VVRAVAAIGFLALPALESRLGNLAIVMACLGLAVFAALGAGAIYRSEAEETWLLSATDAGAILLVIPAVAVTGSIVVADPQIGGAGGNALAGMLSVIGAVLICAVVAITTSVWTSPRLSALALLPAALLVASVVLGAEQFGTHRLPQGIAGALVIASMGTLIEGLTVERYRSLVPPLTFAIFAVVIAVTARTNASGSMTSDNQVVTLVGTTLVGCLLVALPSVATRVRDETFRPTNDRPRGERGRSRYR
jgi:hypothetical protein